MTLLQTGATSERIITGERGQGGRVTLILLSVDIYSDCTVTAKNISGTIQQRSGRMSSGSNESGGSEVVSALDCGNDGYDALSNRTKEVEEEETNGLPSAILDAAAHRLTAAVIDGELNTVKRLLDQGSNPNSSATVVQYPDVDGEGNIQHPVASEVAERARKHLYHGMWPLLAAVKCQNTAMIQLLVQRGARCGGDIGHGHEEKKVYLDGKSELHVLADLQRGPFPPYEFPEDQRFGAALFDVIRMSMSIAKQGSKAVWWGQTGHITRPWELLLSAGACIAEKDNHGVTPFHIACARGNWPIVLYLLLKQNKMVKDILAECDHQGQSPLHHAARHGRDSIFNVLFANGVDPAISIIPFGFDVDIAEVARDAGHKRTGELVEKWRFVKCPLINVPSDILFHVLQYLEPYDLCQLSQTCRALNEFCSHDHVWRPFCDSTWTVSDSLSSLKPRYMKWLRSGLRNYVGGAGEITSLPRNDERACLCKLIIVGDTRVGKSAMLDRFVNGQYQGTYLPTIGVEFGIKTVTILNELVKIQVWDTTGQPRFVSITTAYYRGAQGAMLVYDVTNRESFNNITDDWYEKLKQSAMPNAVVMLVGTKADLEEQRAVTAEEGRSLASRLGALWMECSSSMDVQVDKVFTQLVQTIISRSATFPGARCSPEQTEGCVAPSLELLQRLSSRRRPSLDNKKSQCVLQ